MSGQTHLFPESNPPEAASRPGPAGAASGAVTRAAEARSSSLRPKGTAPVWLQRMSLFILVLFCVYLGVLVVVLPWWSRLWDHNLWINSHPAIASVLRNGGVRGLISGLGLLDIWVGISEAVHYRDYRG